MFNSFVIAGLILWIGSKLTPGQRLAVRLCFFILVLLPLTIVLIHAGAFEMAGEMSLVILRAVATLFALLWTSAIEIIAAWI